MKVDMNSVRGRNMQKRRTRILAEARALLARGGFEALNLRDLARQAEVTVPTIYNLIGKKEEVLIALAADVVDEVEMRIDPAHNADPLSVASAVVVESVQLFREDETFYRSAVLAVEWLDHVRQQHQEVEQLYAWVGSLLRPGIAACREAGLLRGRVPLESMTKLITRNYRMSCRAWALGYCSLDEFRDQTISDLYIVLAADAVDTFHAQLLRKIAEHHANDAIESADNNVAERN
tara:strand:- start:877 stop:1581 length:705 start_codon:yes stop_codon:yes gene_type:complete